MKKIIVFLVVILVVGALVFSFIINKKGDKISTEQNLIEDMKNMFECPKCKTMTSEILCHECRIAIEIECYTCGTMVIGKYCSECGTNVREE